MDKKIVCERCGNICTANTELFLIEDKYGLIPEPVSAVRVCLSGNVITDDDYYRVLSTGYYLCKDCYESFKEWYNSNKKSEE